MTEFQMNVSGMTCDDCNVHVARALERAGAREREGGLASRRGRVLHRRTATTWPRSNGR